MSITDVIYVKGNEMCDFYKLIKQVSDDSDAVINEFDAFTNYHFNCLNDNDRENIEYLFVNKIYGAKNILHLPSFFVRREMTTKIVEDIKLNKESVFIIRGSHFSGKTYVLLDILKEFGANALFFKGGAIINDEFLLKLALRKNTLTIFDENSLSFYQINMLREGEFLSKLKANNVKVVIAINCSIGMFTKHFYDDYPSLQICVKIYNLSPELSDNEMKSFNHKVGKLGLSDYEKNDTLLDYVLRIDSQTLNNDLKKMLPNYNIFSIDFRNQAGSKKKILKVTSKNLSKNRKILNMKKYSQKIINVQWKIGFLSPYFLKKGAVIPCQT